MFLSAMFSNVLKSCSLCVSDFHITAIQCFLSSVEQLMTSLFSFFSQSATGPWLTCRHHVMCTKHIVPQGNFGVDEGQNRDICRFHVSQGFHMFCFHQHCMTVTGNQKIKITSWSFVLVPPHDRWYLNRPSVMQTHSNV